MNNYNERYKAEAAKYGKSDVIIAIVAFLFYTFWILGSSFLPINLDSFVGWQRTIISSLITFCGTIPVFVFILVKRRGLSSTGIKKEKLLPALCLGMLVSLIPIFFGGILPIFMYGATFVSFDIMLIYISFTLIVAASEDLVFVGFIQPRLSGFFKKELVAIGIGSILFGFMHIPNWIYEGTLVLDVFSILFVTVNWVGMHFMFVAIFKRHFSIFPVIMLHTISNLIVFGRLIDFPDGYYGNMELWLSLSFVIMLAAVGIWSVIMRRRR
ncbi:MAG: CPBP family intramembrane metalloprotease [Defluviitaleaceae bacterium]|nr:CPBP family intramembrane metalloprotease [Defluviitaleaceae bacterium]